MDLTPRQEQSRKASPIGDAAVAGGAKPCAPWSAIRLPLSRWSAAAFFFVALFAAGGTQALASGHDMAGIEVGGGGTLAAGDRVEIRWAPLPEGTAEFELLLECDLPRPLTLRLTECEDPGMQRMVWRVPNVPCMSARLVLRRGEGGHEIVWGRSEAFRITWSHREMPERAEFQEGELWLRTAARKPRPNEGASDLWRDGGLGRLPAAAVQSTSASWLEPAERPVKRPSGERCGRAGKAIRYSPREPLRLQLRI